MRQFVRSERSLVWVLKVVSRASELFFLSIYLFSATSSWQISSCRESSVSSLTTNNECTRCAQTNQMIFFLINSFSRCIVNENFEKDVCDCCLFRHRDSKCSRNINYELDLIESMRSSRRQYQSSSTLDQRFDTRISTRQSFESIIDVFVYLFVRVNRRQATSFEASTSSQISNSKITKEESLFIFDENDNVLENENDSTLAWVSTSSNIHRGMARVEAGFYLRNPHHIGLSSLWCEMSSRWDELNFLWILIDSQMH